MRCSDFLASLQRQVGGEQEGGEAGVIRANQTALDRFVETYHANFEHLLSLDLSLSDHERDESRRINQAELDEALGTELPSPLQELPFYLTVRGLADAVERAIPEMGYGLPVKPVVGTLPVGNINAATFPCTCAKTNSTFLLVFSSGLLTYLHVMAGVVLEGVRDQLSALRISRQQARSKTEGRYGEYLLVLPRDVVERFAAIVSAFVFDGDLEVVPPYYTDIELYKEYTLLRDAMEMFVVAHEYSHIVLDHFSSQEIDPESPLAVIPASWVEEYEADELARRLCQGHWGAGYGFLGADAFLSCIETLERVLALAGKRYPGPKYPPAPCRRDFLRSHLDEAAEYAGKIPDLRLRISDLEERCLDFQVIAGALFEDAKEAFRGRPVSSIWESATWHMATRWQRP